MKIIMLTDALVGETARTAGDVFEVDRETAKRLVGKGSAAPAPEPEAAPVSPRSRPRAATPGA